MVSSTAKEAWEILKNAFKGSDKVISIKLQSLWKEFDNLLMKEGESVEIFFNRVSNIINQIRSYGDTIEDKRIIQKILRSLPVKYDHIVAAIEESNKDLSVLTMVELMGSLQAHEERMRRFTEQPLEQAFQSKLNVSRSDGEKKNSHEVNFSQKRGNSNYRGKGRENYRNQGSQENRKRSPYCRLCKMNNHDIRNCRYKCKRCKFPNHLDKDCYYKQNGDARFIEKGDSGEQIFYSCLNSSQESLDDIWYVDSGCSNHMTGNKNSFVDYDENISSQIILGGGRNHDVKGKGTIAIKTKVGSCSKRL